jgi:hypothetical protein
MGIRYYAYPVSPREITEARENPCRFHGDDPLMDAWGPAEERPPMLYLDKCSPCLQRLFDLDGPSHRPAAELVRGSVTHVSTGWIPYERVLAPSQVAEIAADLDAFLRGWMPAHTCRFPDGGDCASRWVPDARDFTRELEQAGYGLVYMIG